MVTSNIQLASLVHSKSNCIAYVNNAFSYLAYHNDSAVGQLLGGSNIDYAGRTSYGTQIAQLAAALSVESGYITDNSHLSAIACAFHGLCIMSRIQLHNGSRGCSLIHLQRTNLNAGGVIYNRTTFLVVASITSHLTLYFQSSIKASLVHG